ncbi:MULTISPECIES: hypothetical protein [unclassified Thioalkalivibrio]|uniref:hypothetical protein n=1 Tax=unclassified Thioalkalivibrio TaxID=2621013 RepID=UPI00036938CC|nr:MULTISPECIES: hypothetical protein [unclassified Thioalkalivibrio]
MAPAGSEGPLEICRESIARGLSAFRPDANPFPCSDPDDLFIEILDRRREADDGDLFTPLPAGIPILTSFSHTLLRVSRKGWKSKRIVLWNSLGQCPEAVAFSPGLFGEGLIHGFQAARVNATPKEGGAAWSWSPNRPALGDGLRFCVIDRSTYLHPISRAKMGPGCLAGLPEAESFSEQAKPLPDASDRIFSSDTKRGRGWLSIDLDEHQAQFAAGASNHLGRSVDFVLALSDKADLQAVCQANGARTEPSFLEECAKALGFLLTQKDAQIARQSYRTSIPWALYADSLNWILQRSRAPSETVLRKCLRGLHGTRVSSGRNANEEIEAIERSLSALRSEIDRVIGPAANMPITRSELSTLIGTGIDTVDELLT